MVFLTSSLRTGDQPVPVRGEADPRQVEYTEADVSALFETAYVPLCRAVTRMLRGDHCAAEQVVMDAFEILYVRRRRIRPATASSYLWRVAINEARTAASKTTREAAVLDAAGRRDALPSAQSAGAAGMASVEYGHVRALVDALPANQRIAVVLHYYCDWADADIAAAMGCPAVTVRSWLRRARKALANQLTREGETR